MKEFPRLETERLILRELTSSDAPTLQRVAGDRAIADTTLNIPHPYEDGMAEEWIARVHDQFDQGESLTFAIVLKGEAEPIGAIGLSSISRDHSRAEFGYWVGRPHWNNGYCTEAGEAVLSHAFSDLGLNRIYASHFARNASSGRVMQKLGMRHEGRQEQHVRKWGVFEDIELYGLLAREWAGRPDRTAR